MNTRAGRPLMGHNVVWLIIGLLFALAAVLLVLS